MYILRRFCGPRFDRVNAILDHHLGLMNELIHLIPSSSYPFAEVQQAMGYPIHVFPTEGMPGRRYLPGSQTVDQIEARAESLVRTLFGCTEGYAASIQPHSGTQANQIVCNAVLEPEDLVLSLKPNAGGHISHTVLIGRRNRVEYYPLDADQLIDYDRLEGIAMSRRPKLIIAGGSSYPRALDFGDTPPCGLRDLQPDEESARSDGRRADLQGAT